MPVTFVFIGIYDSPQLLGDNTIKTLITLDIVKTLFINFGFNSELIHKVNFMCNSKNLKRCNIELINDENQFIQVFSTDQSTKEELKAFYDHYKKIQNNQNSNLYLSKTIKTESEYKTESIYQINQKIKNIFSDKDFITLIHIYRNRPELLKLFYQYISSSDIIDTNYSVDIDISDNLKIINDMNLDIPHDNITQALYRTKNHLNLALRYLLFNN